MVGGIGYTARGPCLCLALKPVVSKGLRSDSCVKTVYFSPDFTDVHLSNNPNREGGVTAGLKVYFSPDFPFVLLSTSPNREGEHLGGQCADCPGWDSNQGTGGTTTSTWAPKS